MKEQAYQTNAEYIEAMMKQFKLVDMREQYRDLIVRVAGYSAYFTTLTPGVQEDVISRTGHEL